jgi:hypothetical protein
MDALIEYVEVGCNGLKSDALRLGAEHGRRRQTQGYDARMIVREFQLVSERICELMASGQMPAPPVGAFQISRRSPCFMDSAPRPETFPDRQRD